MGLNLKDKQTVALVTEVAAWREFGRGNHPARRYFGDCMSYATARVAGEPLLDVGGDFELTDIESALWRRRPPTQRRQRIARGKPSPIPFAGTRRTVE
jgi:hypothetical protein